jgi:hypothetical protein
MDGSLVVVAKIAFVLILVSISYLILLIIQKFTKGRIKADSYAAFNGFLFFGLSFNLINIATTLFSDVARKSEAFISGITVFVIILILSYRYVKTKRFI